MPRLHATRALIAALRGLEAMVRAEARIRRLDALRAAEAARWASGCRAVDRLAP